MKTVNVLGSCVSRVSTLKGHQDAHGIWDGERQGVKLKYFLYKHNIAVAMLPPPFSKEEVMSIGEEGMYDPSRLTSMRQMLLKETVPLLMETADYLIMDFYDFHSLFFIYNGTAFGTQAANFMRTPFFKAREKEFQPALWFEVSMEDYLPYVDDFFQIIMQKYDADHIILNRFRANQYYLDQSGKILLISEGNMTPTQCHFKYNDKCRELEQYVIDKYNPYVIDISSCFMGDANVWDNLNASHFENEFYRETYDYIMKIIHGDTGGIRYFNDVRFFESSREGFEEDKQRAFDVEWGLKVLKVLLYEDDLLWANVLDKLWMHAPNDPRVREYMNILGVQDTVASQ